MKYFINMVATTEEEFDKALQTNFYEFKVIGKEKVNLTFDLEKKKNNFRERRKAILIAWDTYKVNVQYGIETETPEQHQSMLSWYENLKKLEENAFSSIPERVAYYIQP